MLSRLSGSSIVVEYSPSMREVRSSTPSYIPGGTALNFAIRLSGLIQFLLVSFMFPNQEMREGLDHKCKKYHPK